MDELVLRSAFAYLALAVFVIATTIGAFLYAPWLGFVVLGVTSGIASYFLGAAE